MRINKIIYFVFFSIALCKEINPISLILSEEASDKSLEMSGLTWANETLLILPQYPNRVKPIIYGIPKSVIINRINNKNIPIIPEEYQFDMNNLMSEILGFQGFEAICYVRGELYFLIEAEIGNQMSGYLVKGDIDIFRKIIKLETDRIEKIEVPKNINNMAFESLLYTRKSLWILFEMNGKLANQFPQIYRYSLSLNQMSEFIFPNIEYRITDFTEVSSDGRFWAINYHWPGEEIYFNDSYDIYKKKYGMGETHQKYEQVERLLEFRITKNKVIKTETNPIELLLEKDNPRNWEGLVKLDDKGFLIISDEHPKTILAFIPYSFQK